MIQRSNLDRDSLEVAEAMATLGGIELDSKQFKTAESWFSKALEIQSRKLPARHEELLRNKNSLALCLPIPGRLR